MLEAMTAFEAQRPSGWLHCGEEDGQLMAGLSQGGVQVGRRKPVIQEGPPREILSESPSAGCGRSREVTNGRFVAAKLTEDPCAQRRLRGSPDARSGSARDSGGLRIPTIVTAHTDERDRFSVRASVVFRV